MENTPAHPISLTQLTTANTTPPPQQRRLAQPYQQNPSKDKSSTWPTQGIPPAKVLTQSAPCPIDWSHPKLKDVTADERATYELRTPWKPKPDYSTREISEHLNRRFNETKHEEFWRKRFVRTNIRVYEATGLWWKKHWVGLEKWVGKPSGLAPRHRSKLPNKKPLLKYDGDTITFLIEEPGAKPGKHIPRKVPLDGIMNVSPFIKTHVKDGTDSMIIKATERTVDGFMALFAPQRRHSLPDKYAYQLSEDDKGTLVFLEVPFKWTIADLFDIYALASSLACVAAQDIVLDQWHRIYLYGVALRESYMSGDRAWNDVPQVTVHSIFDFSPWQLNDLWLFTDSDDKARAFWLSLFVTKAVAFDQVNAELEQYCREFQNDLIKHLPPRKKDLLKKIEYMAEDGHHEEWYDTEPETSDQGFSAVIESKLLPQLMEINRSETLGNSNIARSLRSSQKRLINILQIIDDDSDQYEHCVDQKEQKGAQTDNKEYQEAQSLDVDEKGFCLRYHNHRLHPRQKCYKSNKLAAPLDEVDRNTQNSIERPTHHIEMTIHGIPGFIIQNHTGRTEREFQELPRIFPEWEWEKVRSVNEFHYRPDIQPGHQIAATSGADPTPLLLPVPVYFDAMQPPDADGRWPSHPGHLKGDGWMLNTEELDGLDYSSDEEEEVGQDDDESIDEQGMTTKEGWRRKHRSRKQSRDTWIDPLDNNHGNKIRWTYSELGSDSLQVHIDD